MNIREIEKKVNLTVPIANFPSLGNIGVLNTFKDASGIVCSSWKTLDTRAGATAAPVLARAPRAAKRSRQ